MRVYTKKQKQLNQQPDSGSYNFEVQVGDFGGLDDWVVAGVIFNNHEKEDGAILSLYAYKFGEGFKLLQLYGQISEGNKRVRLQLREGAVGEIPKFEENAGEKFVADLVNGLINEFNGKQYQKGTRDFFKLIENIDWIPERSELKKQRSSFPVWLIAAAAVAVALGAVVWLGRKK